MGERKIAAKILLSTVAIFCLFKDTVLLLALFLLHFLKNSCDKQLFGRLESLFGLLDARTIPSLILCHFA